METQEFDEELQETNRIYKEIGDLSTKELLELQGAITQIKENSQKEKKEKFVYTHLFTLLKTVGITIKEKNFLPLATTLLLISHKLSVGLILN